VRVKQAAKKFSVKKAARDSSPLEDLREVDPDFKM